MHPVWSTFHTPSRTTLCDTGHIQCETHPESHCVTQARQRKQCETGLRPPVTFSNSPAPPDPHNPPEVHETNAVRLQGSFCALLKQGGGGSIWPRVRLTQRQGRAQKRQVNNEGGGDPNFGDKNSLVQPKIRWSEEQSAHTYRLTKRVVETLRDHTLKNSCTHGGLECLDPPLLMHNELHVAQVVPLLPVLSV